MTSTQAQAVAVLRRAKREIETKGWTQGEGGGVESEDLPCCAGIAINRCAGVSGPASYAVYAALSMVIKTDNTVAWNDHPSRTVDEVYGAFDSAIALIEAGEVS